MSILSVHHSCAEFDSFRAAQVKSLFNCESGASFDLEVDAPLETVPDWQVGAIVGPSGSGKSSLGQQLWGPEFVYEPEGWASDAPVIDGIGDDFNAATAALSAVGLGDVPAWLRPYDVLSMGERFRADMAKIIADAPEKVVIDEFTSVIDRQIARIGAMAFARSWRRTSGKVVVLSPHYDILDWLQPDWVIDTAEKAWRDTRGSLQRPPIEVEVVETGWRYWPLFEPHHYLRAGPMPYGKAFVAFVDGEPVAHLGMSGKTTGKGNTEARACRMVVLPEWQGAGIGMRFLNVLCQRNLDGDGYFGRPVTTLFHTSHPGLCASLRRDRRWRQVSAVLHGANKAKSRASMGYTGSQGGGFGGHFRAVQGYRYVGAKK